MNGEREKILVHHYKQRLPESHRPKSRDVKELFDERIAKLENSFLLSIAKQLGEVWL